MRSDNTMYFIKSVDQAPDLPDAEACKDGDTCYIWETHQLVTFRNGKWQLMDKARARINRNWLRSLPLEQRIDAIAYILAFMDASKFNNAIDSYKNENPKAPF